MYMFLRFPGFKRKALTFSYDDGTVYDKPLAEIFNKYGMKGTFNLNSGSFGVGRRLSLEDLHGVFDGTEHEIAVHGVDHLSLAEVPESAGTADIILDRIALEREFGGIIRGMAYANGSFNDNVVEMLKKCGIAYSRTTVSTHTFNIPTNWLKLDPTCHHRDPMLMELADKFLDNTVHEKWWRNRPELFYVWGHSYEFNDNDNWYIIEDFCKKLAGKDYIWYATNIEIYNYVKAYDSLIYSANGKTVTNPTSTDVYIVTRSGVEYVIRAGETIDIQ